MFKFEKTKNKTRNKTYTAFLVPTSFWTLWNIIKNAEAGISFSQQLWGLGMITIDVVAPLIIGLFLTGVCWLWFEFKDSVSSYIDRLEEAEKDLKDLKEKEVKRISDNEARIKRIENNLILQEAVNNETAKYIAEESGIDLGVLFNKYEAKQIEIIKTRNTNLSKGQASTGLQKSKQAKSHFHELN